MREPDPHVLLVQQLFLRDQPQLRAFVLSLLPDFVGVDDVMQEVFLPVTTKADGRPRGDHQHGPRGDGAGRHARRHGLCECERGARAWDEPADRPGCRGVDRGRFDAVKEKMASDALTSGSPQKNPIVPTAAEIVALYEEA